MADQETVTLTRAQVEELRAIIHNADSPLGNRLQDVSSRLYFALDGAGWTPAATPAAPSDSILDSMIQIVRDIFGGQAGSSDIVAWEMMNDRARNRLRAALAQPAPVQAENESPGFTTKYPLLNDLLQETWWLGKGPNNQDTGMAWFASLEAYLASLAEPVQAEHRPYDEAVEAVRHGLNALPRFSFVLDGKGAIARAADRSGRWIDWQSAHELFDPVVVDSLLAKSAPVQQDAPAPSMVGDAVDALRQLVEQIEKASPVDDHGHLLTMNTAFIRAKEML